MLGFERMNYIMRELELNKSVTINELAEKYNVSPSTIRRNLNELAREGIVKRTYGGAVLLDRQGHEIPYQIREVENPNEKLIIAELAAKFVRDDSCIFMDSTSTVRNLIRFLTEKKNLKIITNSILVTTEALQTLDAQIYCTGGWAHGMSMGFVGEDCRRQALGFYVDTLFMSVYAVDLKKGVTGVNEDNTFLRRELIKNSQKTILLVDHSKLGRVAYRKICDLKDIDYIITDRKPSAEWISKLQEENVELIYPGSDQIP